MKAYTLDNTDRQKPISPRRLAYLLGRSWRMLAIVIAVTLAGAYLLGRLLPPVYRASATVQVLSGEQDVPDADAQLAITRKGQTAASVATLPANLAVVREQLGLETEVSALAKQVDATWNAEAGQIEIAVEHTDPVRAAAIANAVADQLVEQNMGKDENGTIVVRAEQALTADSPRRPWLLFNLIGAGTAGLLAGGAVMLARETTDNTIRSPYDIVPRTGLRLLGLITPIEGDRSTPVVVAKPHSSAALAFRSLYSAIQQIGQGRPINALMVTSPAPKEGKSTVATNLATVMALGGCQVLLIDVDLRRPSLHKKLLVGNQAGVSDLYNRPLGHLPQLVQPTQTPGLDVLTAGPIQPDPARLMHSERTLQILHCARRHYDTVVVDTPPILAAADALSLSRHVDGVVFVVRARKTKQQEGEQALIQLRDLDAELLGVVLNDLRLEDARLWYGLHGEFVAPPASSLPTWRDQQCQGDASPSYEVVRNARQAAYLETLNRANSQAEQARILAEMKEARLLRGMNLWAADLSGIRLSYADLRDANLGMATLQGASLTGANLCGANLGIANLQAADLRAASLSGAALGYVNLQNADLIEADLSGANLAHANLQGADLRYADLRGAILNNAELDERTRLPDDSFWAPGAKLERFTDPEHPDFWHVSQIQA